MSRSSRPLLRLHGRLTNPPRRYCNRRTWVGGAASRFVSHFRPVSARFSGGKWDTKGTHTVGIACAPRTGLGDRMLSRGSRRRASGKRRRPPHTWDGLLKKFSARLNAGSRALAAKSETLDQRAVTRDVDVLEVAEQTTALTDHQEQTTTRVVVVLVLLQVLCKVLDALRQHRDLHLGGSGVTGVRRVLFDDRLLSVRFEWHRWDPLSGHCAAPIA